MTAPLRSVLSLAAGLALVTACATGEKPAGPAQPAPAHSVAIQSVNTGLVQRFVQCVGDCAKPTPKTVKTPVVRTAAVAAPPPPAPPAATPEPVETEPDRYSINFGFNSASLGPTARKELRRVADQLAGASEVRITGFTDSLGPQSPNTKLAEARAVVVMRALRELVPDLQAEFRARGQALCCYLANNATEAGRESNRRAEVAVTRRRPGASSLRAQPPVPPATPRAERQPSTDTATAS